MFNERCDHGIGRVSTANSLSTIRVDAQLKEHQGGGIFHSLFFVFQQLSKEFEIVNKVWSGSLVKSKAANQKSSLLSALGIFVFKQSRGDGDNVLINHLVCRFLIVDELIQSFQSISTLGGLKVLLLQDLVELINRTIEVSIGDLIRNNF